MFEKRPLQGEPTTEVGEEISISVDNVVWSAMHLLESPQRLGQWRSPHASPYKRSKVELQLALCCDGWSPTASLEDKWALEKPNAFVPSLTRPKSYFAALTDVKLLVDKGVKIVNHNGLDGYYRMLLGVPGPQLLELLNECSEEDTPNAWFLEGLAAHGDLPEDDDDEVDDGRDNMMLEDDPAVPGLLPPLIDQVVETDWARCVVTDGERGEQKLYFTSASAEADFQRGFMMCERHQCRRYRPCSSYTSRSHMAADMYLWFHAQDFEECGNRDSHLGYTPDDSAVHKLKLELELRDF